jgi:hypothetical protein
VRRVADGAPLVKRYRAPAHPFVRKFSRADVALLAETDALHGTLSGPATVHLLRRAYSVYRKAPTSAWPACRCPTCTTYAEAPAGVCPSCNARRMVETAAHLVDQVCPPLPVRQWVLALPKRLRYFLNRDPEALGAVLHIFLRVTLGTQLWAVDATALY